MMDSPSDSGPLVKIFPSTVIVKTSRNAMKTKFFSNSRFANFFSARYARSCAAKRSPGDVGTFGMNPLK
jgi:hypothetical protein